MRLDDLSGRPVRGRQRLPAAEVIPSPLIDIAHVGTGEVEFILCHPDDPTRIARLGHDPQRGGAFVETTWAGVVVALDASDVDPDRDPVVEIVAFLANFGFVPPGALDDFRAWLRRPTCWRSRRAPRRVSRLLRIVEALEKAAS